MTICDGRLDELKNIKTVNNYLEKLSSFVRSNASTSPNPPKKSKNGDRPNFNRIQSKARQA